MKCPKIDYAGMSPRERAALAKVLRPLVREAGICRIAYDREYDVFHFRGKRSLRKDVDDGYVLSVHDANAGAWKTIYEPSNW